MSSHRDSQPDAFAYYGRLNRVRNYLNNNISEDLPLSKAAKIAGLEKKYFSTYFHKKTGMCFKRWSSETRVNRAMKIMESQYCSVTDVAFAVGFRDLRTFERAFKKHARVSPLQYRISVQSSLDKIDGTTAKIVG